MSVITIRGQLGSGAPEIGKLVADKLKIDYVDRDIIAMVAEQIKRSQEGVEVKEMPPGTLAGRILEAFEHSGAISSIANGMFVPDWEPPLDDASYRIGLESVIKQLADSESLVIRGRGSQFILRDSPEAFHVLIVAPLELRIKRVMEDLQIDDEAAKKRVEHFDISRREFATRYFKAELEDPGNYDLVVNTRRLIFEDAAALIISICSQYFTFKRKAFNQDHVTEYRCDSNR
ncbi:MAG: cytidylate kinase-like family protein [Dehalococcoidia bacterium]|nr:cytidylate kinase-like family protein [Dehalococcoidia bacterium]